MGQSDQKKKGANLVNGLQFFDKRENKANLIAERKEEEDRRKLED
jgi:hypothetical protein